jgi:hypothetical protein
MQVAEMTVTLRLSNLEPLWQLSDAIQEVRSVSERLGVQEEMMPCCTALLSAAENILKSMTVESEPVESAKESG